MRSCEKSTQRVPWAAACCLAATVIVAASQAARAGERKFVVMLAHSPKAFVTDGTPGLPPDGLYDVEEIEKDYFDLVRPDIDSFAEYWEEISYGDVTVTGKAFGWVSLPWAFETNSPNAPERSSPENYIDLYSRGGNACNPAGNVPLLYAYGAGEEFCDCMSSEDDNPEITADNCGALIIIDLVDDAEQQLGLPPPRRGPGMSDMEAVGINVWTPGERFVDIDGDLRWDGIDEVNNMMCHGEDGCQNVCTGWVCVDEEFGFPFAYCTTDADCPNGSICRRGSLFGTPCQKYCSSHPGDPIVPCRTDADCAGIGSGICMDPCPLPETCGDDAMCSDGSGVCYTSADCPPGVGCVKPGPRGCNRPGCGDLSMPCIDWNENDECDNEGGDDPRTTAGCTPVVFVPCFSDADCPFLATDPQHHVPCLLDHNVCDLSYAIACDDDRDCPNGMCVALEGTSTSICMGIDLCIPPLPDLPELPECCEPGLTEPDDIQACRDEGKVFLCRDYPQDRNCRPEPEGVACGEPQYCCEFEDPDGDGQSDYAEPFEDFIVRWEPSGYTKGTVWVPVTREYIENNYPGDVPALITRTGNGYYDPPDLFLDHTEGEGETPVSTKMMQDPGTRQHTWAVPKPGSGTYANVNEQPWFDNWWQTRYTTAPPPWPGGAGMNPGRNAPRMRAFDPEDPVPPVIDHTEGRRWFQANRGGWNGFGRGTAEEQYLLFDIGEDDWDAAILPDEEFGYYDGWVEHDDLPSSRYHREGDKRLGEVTSPGKDTVTLDGEEYPAIFGADLGAHDPRRPNVAGDWYGVAAGPHAINIHGEKGYDAGDVCIVEWLTWRRDGKSLTYATQWESDNGSYHPYAGPSSPIRPTGLCTGPGQCTDSGTGCTIDADCPGAETCDPFIVCVNDVDCPVGETCTRPPGALGFRDYNLDGMIDQGEVRPELSENYSIDANPFSPNDGTGSDYPFNRRRMLEDIVEALDPSVDWDDFVDDELYWFRYVSGIVLVPPNAYTNINRFPTAPWFYSIHTEDTPNVRFHDLVICQDCREFPSALGYAAHEYMHTWEGYPDLYDYDVFEEPGTRVVNCPIGVWDIMAGTRGRGGLVHPVAPLKEFYSDWIRSVDLSSVLTPGVEKVLTLPPAELVRDDSYFYLENDERPGERYYFWSAGSGFDVRFPGQGMLVLRTTDYTANQEALALQQRTPPFNFDIVQADGNEDLAACATTGNDGDAGDLWPGSSGATEFNFDTYPSAAWNTQNRWTGLSITDVVGPDESGAVRVTLSWMPTSIPSLQFVDPPGGVSVGSIYQVRFNATDVYGGTNISVYYTTNEDDLTILPGNANRVGQRAKDSPGTARLSMDWSIAGLADARYFMFAKLIPGVGADGSEIAVTDPRPGRNNEGNGNLTVLNVDVSSNITSTARSESWTAVCIDPDGQEWLVNSLLTQPEPEDPADDPYPHAFTCLRADPSYPTCGPFQHSSIGNEVTFVIREGTEPFKLGDSFTFTTTGITEVSNGVTIVDGRIRANPIPAIEASLLTGWPPLTVDFDARNSVDPEGLPLTYSWDFGDGQTATGATVSHVFYDALTYTVVLRATNPAGLFGETSVDIIVINNSPNAVVSANPTSGGAPLTVQFNASDSSDTETAAANLIYQWDFGDGKTANDTGQPGILIQTSHFYSAQADGTPCTSDDPCIFNAALTVTDTGGKTDTATIEISVGNTYPVPIISVSRTEGPEPLDVVFNAINSVDADSDDLTVDWYFGDGETLPNVDITVGDIVHRYWLPPGETTYTYYPTATVSDGRVEVDWIGPALTVTQPQEGASDPQAKFEIEAELPLLVDQEFTVNASDSRDRPWDAPNLPLKYEWEFGDDTGVITGRITTHVYKAPGDYQIKLTVTDSEGHAGGAMRWVEVVQEGGEPEPEEENLAPSAFFAVSPSEGFAGATTFTFDASTSQDPEGGALEYRWEFGDNSPAQTGVGDDYRIVQHTYAAPNTYRVRLTVFDEFHASSGYSRSILVKTTAGNQAPTAYILTGPNRGYAPLSLTFDGQNSYDPDGDPLESTWEFGHNGTLIELTVTSAGTWEAESDASSVYFYTDPDERSLAVVWGSDPGSTIPAGNEDVLFHPSTDNGATLSVLFRELGTYTLDLAVSDGLFSSAPAGLKTIEVLEWTGPGPPPPPPSPDDEERPPSYEQDPGGQGSFCGLGMLTSFFGTLFGLSFMRLVRRRRFGL